MLRDNNNKKRNKIMVTKAEQLKNLFSGLKAKTDAGLGVLAKDLTDAGTKVTEYEGILNSFKASVDLKLVADQVGTELLADNTVALNTQSKTLHEMQAKNIVMNDNVHGALTHQGTVYTTNAEDVITALSGADSAIPAIPVI